MRFGLVAFVLVATVAPAVPANAQSLPENAFNDIRYGVSDILAVWTSPFRGSGSDYATAGLAVAAFGVTALADEEVGRWIRDHRKAGVLEALKPFREMEGFGPVDLGSGPMLVRVGGAIWLVGLVAGSPDIRDAGIGCVAAEKSNGILRSGIYKAVHRERPLYRAITDTDTIYRFGDPYAIEFPGDDEDWHDNSFFGGHGANIMSCASFINHRFDLGYLEPVIWTVAVGVNVGRMADERHWASDTLLGAVLGFAIGKYVGERSLARANARTGATGGEDAEHDDERSFLSGVFVDRDGGGRTRIGWRRSF